MNAAPEPRRLFNVWTVIASILFANLVPVVCVGIRYTFEQRALKAVEAAGGSIDGLESVGPNWLLQRVGYKWAQIFDRVSAVRFYGFSDPESNAADLGLAALRELKNLKGLDFLNTALVHSPGFLKLNQLNLSKTRVTGSGMAHLGGMRSLKSLSLNETSVSDAGMVHLRALRNLELLDLRWTGVSDAGLPHLGGLSNLQYLRLGSTCVTEDGINALTAALMVARGGQNVLQSQCGNGRFPIISR